MSLEEGITYLIGMVLFSIGMGINYGTGMGIASLGILMVFLAIIGDWNV